MPQVIIEIKVLRDASDIPIGVEYNLSGLKVRAWLGIFINDVEAVRFRTNNQGGLNGSLNSIPSEFFGSLDTLGGFKQVLNNATLPETGVIARSESLIEDTFNDGFTNVGNHILELRYL